MLFNSFVFLLFFPLVTLIYFLLPHRWRWLHLLIASCIFYMAFIPVYILILVLTIVIDYWAAIFIENSHGSRRKALLALSIFTNVGILAVFKYYNFFIDNLNVVFHSFPALKIILPIGLSFHTFQAMSYTIEVYRGRHKAERHFGIYSLYVMFFPQLVAGPIERPQNLLHQFHEKKSFDVDDLIAGLKLIGWGLFKKAVIADRLAAATDYAFNNPSQQTSLAMMLAVIFFSFQIYCDFSGYSDIALGTARILGFKLMKNFDAPYQSKSLSEFWRRWHISLSTWFRDYLYISMGGNRVSIPRWYFNLFFVFLISGFWHGANWTFIIWGALHGFYIIAGLALDKWFGKKQRGEKVRGEKVLSQKQPGEKQLGRALFSQLRVLFTFVLVGFAWIFFRAANVQQAFQIIRKIARFDGWHINQHDLHGLPDSYLGLPLWEFSWCWVLIGSLMLADYLLTKGYAAKLFSHRIARFTIYFVLVFSIIFLGVFKSNKFIYFQF